MGYFRQESRDFYEVLDYYLNLIRKLHIRTYDYLGEMRASTKMRRLLPVIFYCTAAVTHSKR